MCNYNFEFLIIFNFLVTKLCSNWQVILRTKDFVINFAVVELLQLFLLFFNNENFHSSRSIFQYDIRATKVIIEYWFDLSRTYVSIILDS